MKILAKIKKKSLILGILFAMLLIGIVYAADYYQVNSGATSTIDEWSVCKKVTNNNALAIFVPTKTADEWTAFRTYASGVTYAECCSADGVACSSDGDCCSGYCYVDADGDRYAPASGTKTCKASSALAGTDCCDSDSRAYPGTSTYYSSTNNCGGWDYDCSGTVTKHAYTCDKVTSCTVSDLSTELCAEPARTLTAGGTNSYYSCGASATNSCKYGYFSPGCYHHTTYLIGIKSYTVGTNYRIESVCAPPPEPAQGPGAYRYCKCK